MPIDKDNDSINLMEKDATVKILRVAAGWDLKEYDGENIDVDLSCFILGKDGQTRMDEDFVFYNNLKSVEYKEKAYYDFSLIKQLQVNGFPTVFLQLEETKLYMISRGFSDFASVDNRINNILTENNIQ
jgi:hypothetical protein